jgi:nicotinic acid phosphoribosyltransferase
MNPVVIRTEQENETEWGISFSNHNPESKDYFKMLDEITAFRLRDYLTANESSNSKVAEFTKVDFEIRNAIYSLFEIAFKDSNILSVIGSWKDTMTDEFILSELNSYIKDFRLNHGSLACS